MSFTVLFRTAELSLCSLVDIEHRDSPGKLFRLGLYAVMLVYLGAAAGQSQHLLNLELAYSQGNGHWPLVLGHWSLFIGQGPKNKSTKKL